QNIIISYKKYTKKKKSFDSRVPQDHVPDMVKANQHNTQRPLEKKNPTLDDLTRPVAEPEAGCVCAECGDETQMKD
ncbi:hypothetical protein NPIL_48811, partial [Nephila pilipes]